MIKNLLWLFRIKNHIIGAHVNTVFFSRQQLPVLTTVSCNRSIKVKGQKQCKIPHSLPRNHRRLQSCVHRHFMSIYSSLVCSERNVTVCMASSIIHTGCPISLTPLCPFPQPSGTINPQDTRSSPGLFFSGELVWDQIYIYIYVYIHTHTHTTHTSIYTHTQ